MVKTDNRGIFEVLFKDGRNMLSFSGLILILTGIFICAQSFVGEFLPHDTAYLGMSAKELSQINQNIVNFMFHDRVSFGGVLISIGVLYIWLSEFPLRLKQDWAWWVFCISGILGFSSFLTYLAYGYLDSYHAIVTLFLALVYLIGLFKSYKSFDSPPKIKSLKRHIVQQNLKDFYGLGYLFLYFTAIGIFIGGIAIMVVGMTTVFVPQDLEYMRLCGGDFIEINPKLIPLIAHDRASFGGGLASVGLVIFFIVKCADPSKNLWQALFFALSIGFVSAIGIHFFIGYLSFSHLAPAYTGAFVFYFGIILTYKKMTKGEIR